MRRTEYEDFAYIMIVTSVFYDEIRRGWNYRLRNLSGSPYRNVVIETNLEDPD